MRSVTWSWLVPALWVALAGCGKDIIIRGEHGIEFLRHEVPERVVSAPSAGKRIMVLPFMNTATFRGVGPVVNMTAANRVLASGILEISVPEGSVILTPAESQTEMSRIGETGKYTQLLRDYVDSGLVDERAMQKMLTKLDKDILIQGILRRLEADSTGKRLGGLSIQFIAFDRETGAEKWNFYVHGENKEFDRTSKTEENGTQVGLGALGGLMMLGGLGMMGGSIGADDEGAFMGLLIGGTVIGCLAAIPISQASNSHLINKSNQVNKALDVDTAMTACIARALARITRHLGW